MFRSILLLAAGCAAAWAASPSFAPHEIAKDLKGGYHVTVADMNHDGKPDILALASGIPQLLWYENPSWTPHVIGDSFSRMINVAAADTDGDGIPELVLADLFANSPDKSEGRVWLLTHDGDPTKPWNGREIDRLTTSHRIRTAHIDGPGAPPVFINATLAGANARPPEYDDIAPIVFYRPGAWQREILSHELRGVLHGIFVIDWNKDGKDDLLAASFEGIQLYLRSGNGWKSERLSMGNPQPSPKGGSSDVTVGTLNGERFLAAIEPWHGNEIVIYRKKGKVWSRQVIDSEFEDGHSIVSADFDGDGRDEVVAAYRKGHTLNLYRASEKNGQSWERQILDSSVSPAGCAVADFNGDRKIDLVCISSATANLKWYENVTGTPH